VLVIVSSDGQESGQFAVSQIRITRKEIFKISIHNNKVQDDFLNIGKE
jgi:hypothetical protein